MMGAGTGSTTKGSGEGGNAALRAALDHFRGALANAAFISLVVNVLMLVSPLFMLQVYDRVLTSRNLPTLTALLVMVAGTFAMAAVLDALRLRIMARVAAGFSQAVGPLTFRAVIENALQKGGSESTPLRDLETLRQYIAGPGPAAFFDMPWVTIYLTLAFLLHPTLGLLALTSAVLLFCIAYANERATKKVGQDASLHAQRSHALAGDACQGAEVLRAMGMEARLRDRWALEQRLAQDQQLKGADRASAFTSATKMLRLFLQSAVLALGALLAIEGQVSAGTMIAASIIMSRALSPVEQATAQWSQFQAMRRALARLAASLALQPARPDGMTLPAPKGRIAVDGLVVGAPGASKPVLSGISFTLEPGDAVGVVGPSGCGKSALMRAIVGAWPQMAGSVRLDGARIEHWSRAQLGAAMGYVPQDVELFNGSVGDNIARFDPAADPADVVRAAERAGVHDLILRLPAGYNTQLGEGGARLSAGQRQRIALARALYGNPKLLVLDEPNSNLDSAGETALADTVSTLMREGTTVIIVSHRTSILQVVNKMLCLQDGRQIAFGPREEILAQNRPRQPGANIRAINGQRP